MSIQTNHQPGGWPVTFWVWLCVGIGEMSVLQLTQWVATLCAIALTLRQFYLSFKAGQERKKAERDTKAGDLQ